MNLNANINTNGWFKVSATSALSYTSFIGVPVINVALGNTTFFLESDYIQLDCPPLSKAADHDWVGLKDLPTQVSRGMDHLWDDFDLLNGTWYGTSQLENDMNVLDAVVPQWSVGLNQFIDRL